MHDDVTRDDNSGADSSHPRVLDLTGTGVGAILHPRVAPAQRWVQTRV
jgi:hypothetical protein